MRFGPGLAAAGVLVLLSGGCTHGSSRSAPSGPTSSGPSSSTALAAVPPGTGEPATSTSVPASATTPSSTATSTRCTTAGLSVTLAELGAAAGTEYLELDFKNTSVRTCTLEGYPGVSFVDAHGKQIGAPAKRMSGADGVVTMAPSAMVGALMAYHDVVVTVDNCQPTTASGIRVYPPDETASVIVSTSLKVCANPAFGDTAGVSPVTTPANLHP